MKRALERLRAARGVRWLAATGLAAAGLAAAGWGGDGAGSALGALGAVGLLGAGAAALARRSGAVPSASPLSVEARAALGHDAGVALVRAGGRRFLVGYGAGGASALAELEPGEAGP